MPDADDVRARNVAAVRAAFEGVSAGDVDRMLAVYTDDAVLELPYREPPGSVDGREAMREYLHGALTTFRFRLDVTEVHPCADPDQLVVEYASEGEVTTTGKPYANTYIGVYWFRDGLIRRVREFYNPVAAMRALAPDDVG